LTAGPFRYETYASSYLHAARKYARTPLKQAVISASALSLLYPQAGIPGYPREAFLDDLVREAQTDIRRCLDAGATVQIDFTEGRLAVKLDPSKNLLNSFVDLNNRVLAAFSAEERRRIGVHTCPGGDQDSTHSADVDYAELLPALFRLNVGNFYVQLSSEKDRPRVLRILGEHARGDRRIFVGVTDPIDPRIETADEVRDRVLEAAKFIDPGHLGTTDDCGFSPFGDDTSTSRDTAFAKIRARVEGTQMASRALGV
jgi:5-methyltetrahydropteroyltriglutamate--homocysteine methyltransferase